LYRLFKNNLFRYLAIEKHIH